MNIKGFTIDPCPTAHWVACDACNDSELVYGTDWEQDALAWAEEHYAEQKRIETMNDWAEEERLHR